jgi:hypothetical protein
MEKCVVSICLPADLQTMRLINHTTIDTQPRVITINQSTLSQIKWTRGDGGFGPTTLVIRFFIHIA